MVRAGFCAGGVGGVGATRGVDGTARGIGESTWRRHSAERAPSGVIRQGGSSLACVASLPSITAAMKPFGLPGRCNLPLTPTDRAVRQREAKT